MIIASLILNIVVLIPVCFLMLIKHKRMDRVLGSFTAGRGILLAIYITILLASITLLLQSDTKFALALFAMQIIYKCLSPFTVKTIRNPVVVSNLFIAAFHLITVYTTLASDKLQFLG